MNVYKFGNNKPKMVQPKTIFWNPVELKYPAKKVNPVTWDVFTQPLILKGGETKTIALGFGFMMSMGVVLISLSYALKTNQISITNEVVLEETPDVVTTITNNSSKLVKLMKVNFCVVFTILFKKIVVINKMELKEKIYPVLPEARNIPNAPSLQPILTAEDNGQSFRLQKYHKFKHFLKMKLRLENS